MRVNNMTQFCVQVLFVVFYMVLLYIMYFERCRIGYDENSDRDEEETSHISYCSLNTPIKFSGTFLAVNAVLLFLKEVYLQLRKDTTYLKNWNTWVSASYFSTL